MAMYSIRLRRALSLSSSILNQALHLPIPSISPLPSLSPTPSPLNNSSSHLHRFNFPHRSRLFRTSTISLSTRSGSFSNEEIGPDTILFEGCDYEHWLIVVDFPKDVQLSREEMIETYVQTAAKVFGSVEEAKQKIYALSTTTYKGFQVNCSEETSKKFEGLPGVVFVLPDSYIDPVNKEYGGDKYINGEIIERPPPAQFQRQSRGGNRPRRGPYGPPQGSPQQNFSPPRNPPPLQNYGPPQSPPQQQNYGAPQSPPQQNYGSPRYPPPQPNYGPQYHPPPPQQNYGSPQGPPPQQNYGRPQSPLPQQSYGAPPNLPSQWNHGPQQSFSPQQSYGPQGAGDRRDPAPLGSSSGGWDSSQGGRQDSRPPYQVNYNQGEQGNYYPQRDQSGYSPPEQRGFGGNNQQYAPPQGGSYGQGPIGGQMQGTGPYFGQNNPRQREDESFPQLEQRDNIQGGQRRAYATMGSKVTDQEKY